MSTVDSFDEAILAANKKQVNNLAFTEKKDNQLSFIINHVKIFSLVIFSDMLSYSNAQT